MKSQQAGGHELMISKKILRAYNRSGVLTKAMRSTKMDIASKAHKNP